MSHIEKTIARLPSMNAKALTTLRGNANAVLARKPCDGDARQVALSASQHGILLPSLLWRQVE